VLLLGRTFSRAPVEVEVTYRLGASATSLTSLEVLYERPDDGALARRVEFRYGVPPGAPAEQRHRTKLARGRYRLRIRPTDAAGRVREIERSLEVSGAEERSVVEVGE
jgi:hypothetical protein